MGKRIIYNNSLDADLTKKIKVLAASEGKRHNDLIEEAIKDMLEKYRNQKPSPIISKSSTTKVSS
jgi:metal-responsive CopG/Arc/MetJ family transcriptional regulator